MARRRRSSRARRANTRARRGPRRQTPAMRRAAARRAKQRAERQRQQPAAPEQVSNVKKFRDRTRPSGRPAPTTNTPGAEQQARARADAEARESRVAERFRQEEGAARQQALQRAAMQRPEGYVVDPVAEAEEVLRDDRPDFPAPPERPEYTPGPVFDEEAPVGPPVPPERQDARELQRRAESFLSRGRDWQLRDAQGPQGDVAGRYSELEAGLGAEDLGQQQGALMGVQEAAPVVEEPGEFEEDFEEFGDEAIPDVQEQEEGGMLEQQARRRRKAAF